MAKKKKSNFNRKKYASREELRQKCSKKKKEKNVCTYVCMYVFP